MSFPTFDKQDDVPEGFRDAYEEKDGKWVAKVEDVSSLKGALSKERKAREAEAKAAKEAREALEAAKAEREAIDKGVPPEELQKIRADIEAKYKAEIQSRDSKIHELTFGSQVDSVLAAEVVNLKAARKVLDEMFDLSDQGTLVPKADPSVDAKAYVETLRAEYPFLFKGTQAAGGGAAGTIAAGSPKAVPVSKLTGEALQQYLEKHGEKAYYEALDAETVAIFSKAQTKAA